MHEDPHPTRIDYLRYDSMLKIDDLVGCVLRFAIKNPNSDVEDYLRQVTEKIEDVAEGRVGPHEYVQIVMLLRSLTAFARVKPDEDDANKTYGLSITNRIIDTIQGDTQMTKSTLSAMIFRRVKEAVTWAAVSGGGGSDDRITEVVEDCTSRIINDAFGGKTPAEIQVEGLVDAFYEMDPETEDVLSNGTLVVDGMKVLIESPSNRTIVHDQLSDTGLYEARRDNSWCKVENSAIEGAYVTFVGVYEDGVKRKRTVAKSEAWIVKKDTIPRVDGIYYLPTEEIQFTGIPDQVVDALRSLPLNTWEKYLVHVGDDGFESVSQYLWRVERIESEDETDINRLTILRNKKGEYIATGKNETLMRHFIQRRIETVNYDNYMVQTPETNAPKPLLDYLGVNDELVVWDEEGTQVFKGTAEQIRQWADSPTGRNKRYLGYTVARDNEVGGVTLKDFMLGRTE
jgi:hypothetical protein